MVRFSDLVTVNGKKPVKKKKGKTAFRMDGDRENMASPISRVQKIILEDEAGSVIAYYKAFLWMMESP